MRAILINTGVFNATDVVRRNVGQYAVNYTSQSESFIDLSVKVEASSSRVLVSPLPSVAVTILRTTTPVTCQFLLRDNVTTLSLEVSKFLVVDFDFKQLTITTSTIAALVEVHQT